VGYDFGAHRAALDTAPFNQHDFFIFLNGSVIGPMIPINHTRDWKRYLQNWDWVRYFKNYFNKDPSVRLLGTTIACLPHHDKGGYGPKVEGFFWCTNSHGLQLLLQENTILCDHPDKESAILHGEYGLTNCLLNKHGYNISCLLQKYQGIDWRNRIHWNLNDCQHPSRHNSYFGQSIHPYEIVFHKWYWKDEHPVNRDFVFTHIREIIQKKPNPFLEEALTKIN
jgi:hypothetical protein